MDKYQYKVIHVHAIGVYTVYRKASNLGYDSCWWFYLGSYVHDDFGDLVEV